MRHGGNTVLGPLAQKFTHISVPRRTALHFWPCALLYLETESLFLIGSDKGGFLKDAEPGAREMAPQLRVLTALEKDLDLVPINHMVAYL